MSGWIVWLTGLPSSGKTTVARALRAHLRDAGTHAVILDSDELRAILTPAPTYTAPERDHFYRALVALAGLLQRYDTNVIIAATAPKRAHRAAARALPGHFAEIWVRCPLEECRARDPKGLYARAAAGEISTLPGVGVPYEVPQRAEVIVDSDRLSVEEAVAHLLRHLPWLAAIPAQA